MDELIVKALMCKVCRMYKGADEVRDDFFTKSHLANPTLAAAELRKKIDDEPNMFMYTYRHDPS